MFSVLVDDQFLFKSPDASRIFDWAFLNGGYPQLRQKMRTISIHSTEYHGNYPEIIWLWINTYTYHFLWVIHIHKSQLFWIILGFTRYQGFDTLGFMERSPPRGQGSTGSITNARVNFGREKIKLLRPWMSCCVVACYNATA